ncbi:MAG: protease SohB, partial [Gammaproteobacteria bacterium 39-13]
MEFLSQYGLFLAKTLTIIIGIIVTFAFIMAIAQKGKAQDGALLIYNVNERYNEIRSNIQQETLSKKEWKKWLKAQKENGKEKKKQDKEDKQERVTNARLFVVRFDGDMRASEVHQLREVVSAITETATANDEVLVVLESAGGFVHGYGLAASQLQRLRQRNLHLTVAIDKVAASGGYLMACVANRIIAAPFAIVGSIGVVAQIPNFHRLLEKNNIDFELHTAGEFKRTLTMFGENTEKGRQKFQEELEETHTLFKRYITEHRPVVMIDQVATGEHWLGTDALKNHLIDEIQTSDDFIMSKLKDRDIFEISYEEKQKLSDKLTGNIFQSLEKLVLR